MTGKLKIVLSLSHPSLGDKKHSCETCPKKFELKQSLHIHQLAHDRQTRLLCSFCSKQFLSQSFLEQHITLEHADCAPPSTGRAVQLEVGSDDSMSSADDTRELCLSDEDFNLSLERLLTILNGGKTLRSAAESVLTGLIKKAGHQPIANENLESSDQLRANLTLLLQQINEDDTVRSLLDRYSVDEVLVWLVSPVAVESRHD